METLTGSAAAQLLAGKPLCTVCSGLHDGVLPRTRDVAANALAVDDAGRVHVGDAVEGTTICGRNGNAWTWVIATARPQLDEGRAQ